MKLIYHIRIFAKTMFLSVLTSQTSTSSIFMFYHCAFPSWGILHRMGSWKNPVPGEALVAQKLPLLLVAVDFEYIWLFFFFLNMTQARIIGEGGTSSEEMIPLDWPVDKPMGAFSWMTIVVEIPSPLWAMPSLIKPGGANQSAGVLYGLCFSFCL